ncbi:MAG: bifunctional adenosylcobinamide kinase/adenosylcobinamide-phosphate guanylyltransferase, partial [Fusobacterium sp.]|nr:bifunctional adenosylcobinamide kinase/adenosylcobinamide-phosphate guanylyltransferase [Fusobacterium sp.]
VFFLIYCITNIFTNLMIIEKYYNLDNMKDSQLSLIESNIKKEVEDFLEFIKNEDQDLVVVSNEIGMGVVPAYPLGRYFRDICGRMNQIVASKSDEAYLLISGLKMQLK